MNIQVLQGCTARIRLSDSANGGFAPLSIGQLSGLPLVTIWMLE
jgi:hypothetical protein